ncbi:hypothetical protein GALMADRAFT_253210, partial [Galerina marginata CBS 339.88]
QSSASSCRCASPPDVDNFNSNADDCNINSENNDACSRACDDTCQLTSAHSSTWNATPCASSSTSAICQAGEYYGRQVNTRISSHLPA